MTITTPVRPTAAALGLAVAMSLGACGSDDPGSDSGQTSSGSTSSPSPTRNPSRGDRATTPDATQTRKGDTMQIGITISDQRFTANLDDSAAAVDLLAQLPVTVDMVDHGGVEKTGPLLGSLSLEASPRAPTPRSATSATTRPATTSPSTTATSPTSQASLCSAASTVTPRNASRR